MFFYLELAALGLTWLLATWFVCKYHTDEKYMNHPLMRKLYPMLMASMVVLGCIFVHRITHLGELT